MMAQVTNQDPLSPMDSAGMMEQFAQMGSLEQLTNINDTLDSINQSQADLVQSTAATFLDKDMTVGGGAAALKNGNIAAVQYRIPADANVEAVILDAGGSPIRTLDLGFQGPGQHLVEWDGLDGDGDIAPNGRYTYQVKADTAEGRDVPVDLYVTGRVSGVRFENGKQFISMNGEDYTLDEVVSISNESAQLFGGREPLGPSNTLTPMPPVLDQPR